ncbi:MAG: hypothetical protein K6U03_10990, partial [Firmicutes bacterium]|nr:hypothetical protein [Bacillota bacterium]
YLASVVLVAAATLLSYLACLYYTVILFHNALLARSAQAVLLVFIYYLFILSLVVFASTVSRSTAVAGAVSVGGLFLFSVLASFGGWLGENTPGSLSGWENKLLAGRAVLWDALPALGITLGLAFFLLGAAVVIFNRQEL